MGAKVLSIESGQRVKVDLDNGYSQVANELLEALSAADLTGRQFRFLLYVIRNTYGYKNRPMMPFKRKAMAEKMGVHPNNLNNLSRLKTVLHNAKILLVDEVEIGINPVISEWKQPEKDTKSVKRNTNSVGSDTINVESTPPDSKKECRQQHGSVSAATLDSVGGDTKTDPSSLLVFKESNKENIKDMSKPAAQDSKPSQKITVRPDAAVQSKNGKHWGTQADLDSAKYIFECTAVRTMETKEPNWAAWANDLRLMREQDKRDPRHIATLFNFADKHEKFWSKVILSPASLRKNWGKVAAEYNQTKHSIKTRSIADSLSDTSWADGLTKPEGDE